LNTRNYLNELVKNRGKLWNEKIKGDKVLGYVEDNNKYRKIYDSII